MEPRDYREYNASCAVCGRPSEGECPSGCEAERLNWAIGQAEIQWLNKWREQTREWVAHNAVKYISQTFEALKEARLATYAADLKTIPFYNIYLQYKGRPPLHPQYVAAIQRQIQQTEYDLRRNIDSDWRSCVLRYPDVLAHYFSLVNVAIPGTIEPPSSIIPTVPALLPTPSIASKTRSTTGSTAQKKARRVSLSMVPKDADEEVQSLETIANLLEARNLGLGLPPGFSINKKNLGGSKAGRTSPIFDTASKMGGKKRAPKDFLLSGKGGALPRAPTAPPSAGGPWGLPA